MVFSAFFRQTTRILAGLLLLTATAFGQTTTRKPDLIVKRDNTAIEAVINEIEEASVTYRRFSAPTGQLYRIDRSKVKYIRYANGDVEKFDEPAVANTTPTAQKPTQPSGAGVTSAPKPSNPPASTQRPTSTASNGSGSSGSGRPSGSQGSVSSTVPRPRVSSSGQVSKPQAPTPEKIASEAAKAGLKIGVLGGAGLSQLSSTLSNAPVSNGTTSSDLIMEALSLRGGFLAEFPIGPVAIAPSLEFAITKFAFKNLVGTTTGTITLNQAVFSLPVIIPAKPESKLRLYAGAGPYVAYNINGKVPGVDATGKITNSEIKFDEPGSPQQIQAGVMARLGVRLSSIAVFAFGTYSLTDWAKPVTGMTTTVKTNALTAGLQVQVAFGK